MEKRRRFGELELSVFEAVRTLGSATVSQVVRALSGEVCYTTVMTVLSRLAAKGELSRVKEGHHYVYSLNDCQKRPRNGLLEAVKAKVFGGRSATMIAYLLESSSDLTTAEVENLEALLREAKEGKKRS